MKTIDFITNKLDAGKAEDILTIDLTGRASWADTLIIATGTSARHVMALAHHLAEDLKKQKIPCNIQGKAGDGNWVVVDLGNIVVHLFNTEARTNYNLEGMWQPTETV